jgi:hypothetical protein
MSERHSQSVLGMRELLWPLAVGALVAGVTLIPYLVPERSEIPAYVSVPLAAVSLISMPGVMLSMVLTGSTHDPKLLLAGVINAVLYWSVFYWIATRRRRKRRRLEPPKLY